MKIKLTKRETFYLKGIGILIIVFHNFFHRLTPKIGENEFSFNKQTFDDFIFYITTDFINFFQYFISYFGHYGVQIFIFCSGYGLTIVYEKKKHINFKKFIKSRLLKLYPAYTIAILLLLIYQFIIFDLSFTNRTIAAVFIKYTLISNWIPGKITSLSTPYWFYSMIVQLYLCYPFIIKFLNKNKNALHYIFIVSYVIIFLLNDFSVSIDLNLYYNFVGNLPVFVLGIYFANKRLKFSNWIWFLALGVFILGQKTVYFWYFSQVAFVIIVIPVLIKIFNFNIKSKMSKFLIYTGKLSMYIFAVNGFLRMPWVKLSNNSDSKIYYYLYVISFLFIVFVTALLVKKLEKFLIIWLEKKTTFMKL